MAKNVLVFADLRQQGFPSQKWEQVLFLRRTCPRTTVSHFTDCRIVQTQHDAFTIVLMSKTQKSWLNLQIGFQFRYYTFVVLLRNYENDEIKIEA